MVISLHSFVPESFMPVTIVPVIKNASGDVTSANNYRPVAVATTNAKLFELCIPDSLSDQLHTTENQFGFKPAHSTDQCVMLLKERIRSYRSEGGPVYCCFLDASKAFVRVAHATLFLKLIERQIPISFVKILQFWYSHQTMAVRWNTCCSDSFNTSNGVFISFPVWGVLRYT